MATTKSPVSLLNFFVFNPEFGPREGEEEKKILFYHPQDEDIDRKIKNIGLCEAIIKFSETFTDTPCNTVHTQKTRQLFYSPEKDFWIIMTVSIPYSQKQKDGQTYVEYHEDDVQDTVFEAVLKTAYKMFKLFMGPFTNIIQKGNVQNLKQRLDHFFSRYLLTLRLNHSDLLDVCNGIHFLPLDKNTYLRIQCLINLLEATFPQIRYTAFLYNDQLVWSGLEQEDMRIMYKYLTTSLFPSYNEQELRGVTPPGSGTNLAGQPQPGMGHYGKYVTGPPNLSDQKNFGKIPRVFINTNRQDEECHLLVYRALSANLCMLVDGGFQLTFDFFQNINTFLGPQLSVLASDISDQYSRRTSGNQEPQYKYIYFNHMNLAQKTTLHTDSNKKSASINVPWDTLRLISDMNADLLKASDDSETIVKTQSGDCWVVGKKSDQREFYVVISQKNANLIEINEEVKRLCSTHFSNIFFLD